MSPSLYDPSPISRAAAATTTTSAAKSRKLIHDHHHHQQSLLPGLPDHIAQLCLNLVPPSTLYSVCRSWRCVIYTPTFPPFLSHYTLSVSTTTHNPTLRLSSFDPISCQWTDVNQPTSDLRRVCIRNPSFIARNFSFQSLSVAGNLVLLAGTTVDLIPAFSHPLIFNPLSKIWSYGPQLSNPRRWCAAGVSRASVVCASGIGSNFNQTVARSGAKWVFPETNLFNKKIENSNGVWKKIQSLKDVKFSREATDAIGCKEKLYMVNNSKEGVVYDINSDEWSLMPEGMLGGWKGPAAAMDEEIIYIVDEVKGVLRKHNGVKDIWVDVLEHEMLKGAEHIVCGGGRVCVVRVGGVGIVVVNVVASPPELSVLDTPVGEQVLGLHILPRMCVMEL